MNAATFWRRWWAGRAQTPPKLTRVRRKTVSPGPAVELAPVELGSTPVESAPPVPVAHIHLTEAGIEAALFARRPPGVPLGEWLDLLAAEA